MDAGTSDDGRAGDGGHGATMGGGSVGGAGGSGAVGGTAGIGGTAGSSSSGGSGGAAAAGGTGGTPQPPCGYEAEDFCHPGVAVNGAQLDFLAEKVSQNQEPWKGVLDDAKNSSYGALDYAPQPRAVVECGAYSNPNNGCTEERGDALAAYTHALIWALTKETPHAEKAVEILNAWGSTITDHTEHNARLQTGWAGVSFARAGELMRHTYDGWQQADLEQFIATLRDVYLPVVRAGSANTNGNWEAIMTEAALNISVFIDDKESFAIALERWRGRAPAYAYLESDGDYPVPPAGSSKDTPSELIDYWHGQSDFRDGLAQETCRDFGHTQWGIAALLNGAETAYQQGVDLYAEQAERLMKTLEFHADYVLGAAVPDWLCGGSVDLSTTPTFEIGYNHYQHRMGNELPLTLQYLNEHVRNNATPVNYFIAWETLTHRDVGAIGLE